MCNNILNFESEISLLKNDSCASLAGVKFSLLESEKSLLGPIAPTLLWL